MREAESAAHSPGIGAQTKERGTSGGPFPRKFMGLKPEELAAVHECLTWLRQPGNNPLCFYGETGGG